MKITIESTDIVTRIDGVTMRVWEGITEGGTRCLVFVRLVATKGDVDTAEFDTALRERPVPAELARVLGGPV